MSVNVDNNLRDVNISLTAASYSGNKGAAAMLQSSIGQLYERYGSRLNINLMSVYPNEDRLQNPHDFVRIVPATPAKVVFCAFPLALLYFVFGRIPGIGKLLLKNKMLKAYKNSDAVIDEAGVSFIDSRGFVMNTYAFITMAVPKLMHIPVFKYSQALGPFDNFWNRTLAKIILPKLELICARGKITVDYLRTVVPEEKIALCADGAFSMADDEAIRKRVEEDNAFQSFSADNDKGIVCVSVSSVVEKKCRKSGIDYRKKTTDFIDYLNAQGYKVMILAHAARINSSKPRNNDLMTGDAIYKAVKNENMVYWSHREMDAEELREYIGKCRFMVASRFHAMIGALQRKVPVLLVGWSHKYQEVMEQFELENYCIDYKLLNGAADDDIAGRFSSFEEGFSKLVEDEEEIRRKIDKNYDSVIAGSKENIKIIAKAIDRCIDIKKKKKSLIDINNPQKYMGYDVIECRKGYASDEKIRQNAASGGMVTALLISLLKQKKIDGAFVTKTEIVEGKLGYKSMIATTPEEIADCSSSVYMYMPLLKELDLIRNFNGKVAVVLTPCLIKGLNAILDEDRGLREKIVLKLGLFCSGNQTEEATLYSLEKSGVELDKAKRLYYRRGNWRGKSTVIYKDGTEKDFSYTHTICAYKNAYYFEKPQCMVCQNQFADGADISFGDIWLKEMKKEKIKHTGCIIRTENGRSLYYSALDDGSITDSHLSFRDCLMGQKRALVFKFNAAAAKYDYYASLGKHISIDTLTKCSWNHRLAFKMSEKDRLFSEKNPDRLKRKPMFVIYFKMCFIRLLLSF